MTRNVVSVEARDKAYGAVLKMINRDIGSVVVKKNDKVVGIITKGDILRNIVKAGIDPRKATAADVMSSQVVTVESSATLQDASSLMSRYDVSKLPVVVSGGELVGIITTSDIVRAMPVEIAEAHQKSVASKKK